MLVLPVRDLSTAVSLSLDMKKFTRISLTAVQHVAAALERAHLCLTTLLLAHVTNQGGDRGAAMAAVQ